MTNHRGRRRTGSNPDVQESLDREQVEDQPKELLLPKSIKVKDLSDRIQEDPIDVIKELIRVGVMANINQVVDFETASAVVREFGFDASLNEDGQAGGTTFSGPKVEENPDKLTARPPVVTILGHVDHGKTTLLDSIRESKITDGEVGGITQHIGAYQVEFRGQKITFLDTPGHEAFTAMRARGAKVTDIAILVVAADDGVMPQTVEAMNHAKAAGVPIVVAINKMDVPSADPDRVKRQLVENELVIEEWGGDVITVPVSATERQGIDNLLETLLVVSEVAELRGDPDRLAIGVIVEARVDKGKGPLATVLVQTGTLHVGDNVVVGQIWGRIKAMFSESGGRIDEAGPSTPVEVLGLSGNLLAGDSLEALESGKAAKNLVQQRLSTLHQPGGSTNLEEIATKIGSGEVAELKLVVKTDVQGSVDAVKMSLEKLGSDSSRIAVIHATNGTINESDVTLATAAGAIIIGFNTRIEQSARLLADSLKVEIRQYDIIYRLIEDVENALEGLVKTPGAQVVEGHGEVRDVFAMGRRRKIAGVYILDGRIARNSMVKVIRRDEVIHQGNVTSLKHFKDDVREMTTGFECGVGIDSFNDFESGDILEIIKDD